MAKDQMFLQQPWSNVFTMTLIAWFGLNPHPGHVIAFLDKTLYDNYLCQMASNKQQTQWKRI